MHARIPVIRLNLKKQNHKRKLLYRIQFAPLTVSQKYFLLVFFFEESSRILTHPSVSDRPGNFILTWCQTLHKILSLPTDSLLKAPLFNLDLFAGLIAECLNV